jgi:hypothetical protein
VNEPNYDTKKHRGKNCADRRVSNHFSRGCNEKFCHFEVSFFNHPFRMPCSITKAKGQTDNEIQALRAYSRANQIIAKVSVGAVFCFIIIGIMGCICNWYSNYDFATIYAITTFAFVHMLWICSVIGMLLEKELARWHRTINILAPLIINGAIVLALLLEAYIPREVIYQLSRTLTEDIPMMGLMLSIIFVIAVWIINTVVVLRSRTRSKQEQISNQSDNL